MRLMPANYVKPCVKRGKRGAIDAEAICEGLQPLAQRSIDPGDRWKAQDDATQLAVRAGQDRGAAGRPYDPSHTGFPGAPADPAVERPPRPSGRIRRRRAERGSQCRPPAGPCRQGDLARGRAPVDPASGRSLAAVWPTSSAAVAHPGAIGSSPMAAARGEGPRSAASRRSFVPAGDGTAGSAGRARTGPCPPRPPRSVRGRSSG